MKTKLSVGAILIFILIALFNRGQGVTTPQLTAGTSGAVAEAAAPSLISRLFPFLMLATLGGDSPAPCTGPNACQATAIPKVYQVLVINDDDPHAILQFVKATVPNTSGQVAFNCTLAVELLSRQSYDLVILDEMFPGNWMGCYDDIRAAKNGKDVPVLLMSAFLKIDAEAARARNITMIDSAASDSLVTAVTKLLGLSTP